MDDWEKFNEISLPEKEDFYNQLNMEDIIDADYAHARRVCKDFEIKNLGEYHDLYFQSDTLLLGDVFENFRNMCTKIYDLDPAKFLKDKCDEGHFLEVYVQYLEKLCELHNHLPFLPERMKVKKSKSL